MHRFALTPHGYRRRHAQLQRVPAVLAFVAMLLLLVMPTAGRLLGVLTAGSYGMPHAMAMSGHAAATMPEHPAAVTHEAAAHHAAHPALPGGNGQHPDNGACLYCPLLGSMLVALALYVALLAAMPAQRPMGAARRSAYAAGPFHGLGARGPPVPL